MCLLRCYFDSCWVYWYVAVGCLLGEWLAVYFKLRVYLPF